VRAAASEDIDELLSELDASLKRLRMEYEQFFMGSMKREPQILRGKVQKTIIKMVNEPPRNSRQKFRFNTLNSRFQVYRQLWGRTMREMEQGTHKRDKFRASMRSASAGESETSGPASSRAPDGAKGGAIGKLHQALVDAANKSGNPSAKVSREDLDGMIRKQIRAIRAKHGDVKVKFKVVVEGDKTRLKASIAKKRS